MVQSDTGLVVDEEAKVLHATYNDFEILETGDIDVFVLDLNELASKPPFYIEVDGRRFALQRDTFQVLGHGAKLPAWVREQEAAGRLILLAERGERFLVFVHDPAAAEGDEDGADDDEA
jgi:hypothetical protein